MRPLEANIIHEIEGDGITFTKREDLRWGWLAELSLKESNNVYFTRGLRPSLFHIPHIVVDQQAQTTSAEIVARMYVRGDITIDDC